LSYGKQVNLLEKIRNEQAQEGDDKKQK